MKPSFTLSLLTLLTPAIAQDDAISRAETALHVLQDWYNEGNGLWDTVGWWNGANCMTALADLALAETHSGVLSQYVEDTALDVFNITHSMGGKSNPHPFSPPSPMPTASPTASGTSGTEAPSPTDSTTAYWSHSPDWVDGSFDDDGWWALAWIAAYDLTRQQQYLNTAKDIFESLSSTRKSSCSNTGIYSDLNANYVNAVTNELYLSVAAHLANRVPDKQRYYDVANRQWNWFKTVGFINENGTINDGLTETCENNGQPVWSYNQGVVLSALVELHLSTGSLHYLDDATRIAKAAIQELSDPDTGVIQDICDKDNSCDANSTQFKGIFIRNLRTLHAFAPDSVFEKAIRVSAESIWSHDRSQDKNQLGVNWEGPVAQIDASTHSSALDALVAAIGA